MSTLVLQFGTQPLDFSPVNYGKVEITLEVDGQDYDIGENLSLTSGYLNFVAVQFSTPQAASNAQQAQNFADAFNRDHKTAGGLPPTGNINPKNLLAVASGDLVTITATRGIFKDVGYTGNVLGFFDFTINNTSQPIPSFFTFEATSIGNCSERTFNALSASGGTAPYRLVMSGTTFFTGWDGVSTLPFVTQRNKSFSGFLLDANDLEIKAVSLNVPRRPIPGDFDVQTIDSIGFSDINILKVTDIPDNNPLEYALRDSNGNTTVFSQSSFFGGYVPGVYTAIVRDRYGCEIELDFEVSQFNLPGEENARVFIISDFNSLSFAEKTFFDYDARKNYFTALGLQEAVDIPYNPIFCFPFDADIKTQFKSSYPIHVCTLITHDGVKTSLPLLQTQKNIGFTEKVDCKLFPLANGNTGVYFEAGNQYDPGSLTVIDTSPYERVLPIWAEDEERFVQFGNIGLKQILNTNLYDTTLEAFYFEVEGNVGLASDDTVQVTYNRHDYNLYRMDFNMSIINLYATVIIEAGYSFDQIERTFVSEPIGVLPDHEGYLKITWKSDINFDDMVFSDGIDSQMWIKGRMRPFAVGNSETKEADDRVRSILQKHRLGMRVEIPCMTPKQWHKLGLASGISDDGEFVIEDLRLVTTQPLTNDRIGDTNLSEIVVEYAMFANGLQRKAGELVLNPSTGVIGTSQKGVEINDPICGRLRLADGTWLLNDAGEFLAVNL
jgi:hypothetical protein